MASLVEELQSPSVAGMEEEMRTHGTLSPYKDFVPEGDVQSGEGFEPRWDLT